MDIDLQELLATLAEKLKADGCKGCEHEGKPEYKPPCSLCRRACKDYWKHKESKEWVNG